MLYGTKLKPVNEACYAIFEKKRQEENKIIDMAALPPCEKVLHLHSKRANAVAHMWHICGDVNPNLEESSWYLNGDIQWVDDVFPPTIEQSLSDEISENESDSDNEEIENVGDREFMVVTLILITKLLTRTAIYIFIVYVYFHMKIYTRSWRKYFNYLLTIKH